MAGLNSGKTFIGIKPPVYFDSRMACDFFYSTRCLLAGAWLDDTSLGGLATRAAQAGWFYLVEAYNYLDRS